jgi:hypothetical protein
MSGERKFKIKSAIMGGGFALREGEVVTEDQLNGYVEWLTRNDGIEEITDRQEIPRRPHPQAYTA